MMQNGLTQADDGAAEWNLAETLGSAMETGLVAVDAEARVRALNPAAERLLGLRASVVLRQSCDLLPAPLPSILREILFTGKTVAERDVRCQAPGRNSWEVRLDGGRLALEDSRQPGAILTLRDVRAARHLEEQMRRLDRLASLGTLSATASHEIKNALVPIKTFLQLLHQKHPEAELAELALRELGRVESLAGQMLGLANPTTPTLAPVRLQDVLQQTVRLLEHQIVAKHVQLECHLDGDTALVAADAQQLEQAFLNVLLNALEAMPAGGCLEVRTMPARDEAEGQTLVEVLIRDSGVGIEPQNMKRLFETFFTTKPHGTGLGLAVTRRIVREHRGRIHVESQPNQGTLVRLAFPTMPS